MKNNDSKKAAVQLIAAMVIFGSVGIFRRFIPLPSGVIAAVRGIIGMLFLLGVMWARKQKPSVEAVRRNIVPLCLSGAFIGINWILLFEAYNHTTVSLATLCYYTAPVYVILLSPLILKDSITAGKLLCTAASLGGMVLVSGVVSDSAGALEYGGVIFGLGAAVFYAAVMLTNKKLRDISANDRTVVQLGIAGAVIIPYSLIAERNAVIEALPQIDLTAVIMLITVAVVHTGIAYTMYFGSFMHLNAQTAALFSYIDPVVALVLSAVILREKMGVLEIIGAVLIIGSAAVSEIIPANKKREKSD